MGKHEGDDTAEGDLLHLPEVLDLINEAYAEGLAKGFYEGYREAEQEAGREVVECDHTPTYWELAVYAVSVLLMAGAIWLMLNHPGWVAL